MAGRTIRSNCNALQLRILFRLAESKQQTQDDEHPIHRKYLLVEVGSEYQFRALWFELSRSGPTPGRTASFQPGFTVPSAGAWREAARRLKVW